MCCVWPSIERKYVFVDAYETNDGSVLLLQNGRMNWLA